MTDSAQDIINANSASAPVNVEQIARDLGLELVAKANLPEQIAGLIEKTKNSYRIKVNAADHYYRRRFTIAHEIAHFLLHRHLLGDGVDDNRAYRATDTGQYRHSEIAASHEAEANRLAAHILMPPNLVKREYSEANRDVDTLAKRLQVSPAAMKYRLKALGYEVDLT
jgi:Zn-dependent peptidase ImmA (M78 family)